MTDIESRPLDNAEFFYADGKAFMRLEDSKFELGIETLDALLNLLKIPTKYLHRLAAGNIDLANENVNFWLDKKREKIALAVRGDEAVHFTESDCSFVPTSVVLEHLGKYLHCPNPFVTQEDELIVALFKTILPEVELDNGERGFISIRLTYSECFTIRPRVDAVLTVNGSFENYYFPIQKRNFRIANMGQSQVITEILEFSDMVLEQLQKQFIPALNKMIGYDARLNIYGFVERLCTELRLSKKLCVPLLAGIDETEVSLHNLVRLISNNLLPEVRTEQLDYLTAREIEIALSKAIVCGRFK